MPSSVLVITQNFPGGWAGDRGESYSGALNSKVNKIIKSAKFAKIQFQLYMKNRGLAKMIEVFFCLGKLN